jgi:hypothetical protein
VLGSIGVAEAFANGALRQKSLVRWPYEDAAPKREKKSPDRPAHRARATAP